MTGREVHNHIETPLNDQYIELGSIPVYACWWICYRVIGKCTQKNPVKLALWDIQNEVLRQDKYNINVTY